MYEFTAHHLVVYIDSNTLQGLAEDLSVAHPSFRVIATPSKSTPLRDWVSDEHSNMFFPIPSQPMDVEEERFILLATGCPSEAVEQLLTFADKYRTSLSSDNVQKNRKLGTRSLVRIARRVAMFPENCDLHTIVGRSLLAEFLPAVERLNLMTLLEESGIRRQTPPVGSSHFFVFACTDVIVYSITPLPSPKARLSSSQGPPTQPGSPRIPPLSPASTLRTTPRA